MNPTATFTANPNSSPSGYNYTGQNGQTFNTGTLPGSNLSPTAFLPSTTIPAPSVGGTKLPTAISQTPSGAQNSLGAAVAPAIPPTDANGDTIENNRTNANNSLFQIQSMLNPGQETNDLNASTGVNAAQAAKDAADTAAATTAKHYDDLILQAQTNAQGMDTAGVQGTVDQLTRQKNNDLANIAIQQSAATNNLSRLSDIVTKKVTADTDAATAKINAYKDYISNIDADPKEKAQLQAQANAQQAKLETIKSAGQDVLKTAAANGAPTSILDKIGKAISDPNATATSIYESGGDYLQTKTPKAPSLQQGTGGTYEPIDVSTIKDLNVGNPQWGGLSYNGLLNDAQHFLSTGTMPSLGLGTGGNAQGARIAIQNYAGQIADQMGMTQPQIQAMYKANSTSATQIVERMAKIDTISSSATTQFPRLADLADKIKTLGITESDIQKGAAAVKSKFGSVDASNYVELLQTIRGDYAGLQSAMGGSGRGGVFFSQAAQDAIPAGLTGAQYLGIMQTLQQSAVNVSNATQDEAQNLIGVGSGNSTGPAGGSSGGNPQEGDTHIYNGTTYKVVNGHWTPQ